MEEAEIPPTSAREPLITVITSISMDHMDRLGNTMEEIAAEKAGIIKDGCPRSYQRLRCESLESDRKDG